MSPSGRRGHNDPSIDELVSIDVASRPVIDPAPELFLGEPFLGAEGSVGGHDSTALYRGFRLLGKQTDRPADRIGPTVFSRLTVTPARFRAAGSRRLPKMCCIGKRFG